MEKKELELKSVTLASRKEQEQLVEGYVIDTMDGKTVILPFSKAWFTRRAFNFRTGIVIFMDNEIYLVKEITYITPYSPALDLEKTDFMGYLTALGELKRTPEKDITCSSKTTA